MEDNTLSNPEFVSTNSVPDPISNQVSTPNRSSISPFAVFLIAVVVVVSLGAAGVFGYKYIALQQQLDENKINNPNSLSNSQPSEAPQEAADDKSINSESKKNTYTHEKFPKLKISYDSTWTLTAQERSGNNANDTKDLIVTLKKQNTTLTYNIEVGTPMGGAPNCLENAYTKVSDKLVRIKDYNKLGDLYWAGDVYGTKFNTSKMEELEKAAPDAFGCQKTNNCICQASMDNETYVISTTYPTPDDYPVENQKTYGALVKIYVKQAQLDEKVLTEADQIVEESLEAFKIS